MTACLLTELNNINTPDSDQTGYWTLINAPVGITFPFDLSINCGVGYVNTTIGALPYLICGGTVSNPCINFEGEAPGDYQFMYHPPIGSCGTGTSILTITLNETPIPVISCEYTECVYTGSIFFEGDENCAGLQSCDNNFSPLSTFDFSVSSSCNPGGDSVLYSETVCSANNFVLYELYSTDTPLSDTGYIEKIDVSYDDGTGTVSSVTLDVSPTSAAAIACCTGFPPCSSNTNLIWMYGNNPQDLADALTCTIEKAIQTAFGIPSTPLNQKNYDFYVSATIETVTKLKVIVGFKCANIVDVPTPKDCDGTQVCGNAELPGYTTNKWVGAKYDGTQGDMIYNVTSGSGTTTVTYTKEQFGSLSLTINVEGNCGIMSFSIGPTGLSEAFSLADCHFNVLVPNAEVCFLSLAGDCDPCNNFICNSTKLTVDPDCGDVVWGGVPVTDQYSNPTYTTATTGTVTVAVTCGGCTGHGTKTLPCV